MISLASVLLLATVAPLAKAGSTAADQADREAAAANPIRKVVSLLQKMAKTVAKEADEEQALYDKFMCWCSTGGAELRRTIDENTAAVPAIQSSIEESEAELGRLKEEIPQHQADRAAAKAAMADATALREKEHASCLEQSGELKGYVAALAKAIPAIETGMAGTGLLQGRMAATFGTVRAAAAASTALTEDDRA